MQKNLLSSLKLLVLKVIDQCIQHKRILLICSSLMVIGAWLLTRIPYFLYYPIPSIQPDYSSYVEYIWQMEQGLMPSFSYRTPGYPIFMGLVLLFSKKLMSIVFAQHILSLISALLMVFSVFRTYTLLTPFVALGMAAFISSNTQVQVDMSLLTESLFTNFLIISMALIILALKTKHLRFLALASAFMALSIYIRPTGQFFFVTFAMILLYQFINKFTKKQIIVFATPFVFLMLLLPSYNYATYGKFNITNGKEITLICGASFFLEQNPKYSDDLNSAIAHVTGRFSKEDRNTVENSWDFDKIYSSYYKDKYWNISQIMTPFNDVPEAKSLGLFKLYEDLAISSITTNFPLFFKLFTMNLSRYFLRNIKHDSNFYGSTLPSSYDTLVIKKDYVKSYRDTRRKIVLREFFEPKTYKYFTKENDENGYKIKLISTPLKTLHESYTNFHREAFRIRIWSKIFLLLGVISFIMTLAYRIKHLEAFIMLILTSGAIGHGIISSIFANIPRFSAPTEFLYYVCVALIPILFPKFIKISSTKSLST